MATFFDTSLVQGLHSVFAFILVWGVVYALLDKVKIFGDKKHLSAIISIMVALITLSLPNIIEIVTFIVPWFSLIFIFIAFMLVGIMIFGVTEKEIGEYVKGPTSSVAYWVIILSVIILFSAIGVTFFSPDGGDSGIAIEPTALEAANQITAQGTTVSSNGAQVEIGTEVGTQGKQALVNTLFHPRVLALLFVMLMSVFAAMQLAK
ncbi:MAG: hypothetical protein ACI8Y7_000773 [Candidatus Woesearchaeota archaeon]|jgi:hypothetical protein